MSVWVCVFCLLFAVFPLAKYLTIHPHTTDGRLFKTELSQSIYTDKIENIFSYHFIVY